MKPDTSPPASQPTDLPSLLRSLSLQTHLELTGHLQDPLINRLKKRFSQDDVWEYFSEAADYWNRVQGVVR